MDNSGKWWQARKQDGTTGSAYPDNRWNPGEAADVNLFHFSCAIKLSANHLSASCVSPSSAPDMALPRLSSDTPSSPSRKTTTIYLVCPPFCCAIVPAFAPIYLFSFFLKRCPLSVSSLLSLVTHIFLFQPVGAGSALVPSTCCIINFSAVVSPAREYYSSIRRRVKAVICVLDWSIPSQQGRCCLCGPFFPPPQHLESATAYRYFLNASPNTSLSTNLISTAIKL